MARSSNVGETEPHQQAGARAAAGRSVTVGFGTGRAEDRRVPRLASVDHRLAVS